MAQLEQMDHAVGNTKKPRERARSWFFTFNNPQMAEAQLVQELDKLGCEKYCFQREKGAEGTEHYQGCIYFKNPKEFNALKKWNTSIHWEKCKNWKSACDYCSKEDTRIGDIYSKGLPKPLKIIEKLYPWQEELWASLQLPPDDRKIVWYHESEGNRGKTSMAKYICHKMPKSVFVSGKGADIKFAVVKALEANDNELDVVIFHFVRSQEDYISYAAIEEIKDGIFFSGKYEATMKLFNAPHIIVFANFGPNKTQLSADRWEIKEL